MTTNEMPLTFPQLHTFIGQSHIANALQPIMQRNQT